MSLLLHISDTHFGTEQAPVVAALEALARERLPDALVFSGDITQRARPEQFEAGRRLCDRLGIRHMVTLPGNHDIPLFDLFTRATQPYRRYLASFGPRLEHTLVTDDFFIVGVNTTRPSRHKNGEVSPEQVLRVARELQGARPRQLRIVVTHQPVDVYRAEDVHDRLHGAEGALLAWSRAGADLVLGGHIHLPYVMDLMRRPEPLSRPMWCVQAGTAVSSRVRHGTCNSVNLIHWKPVPPGEPRHCLVERCDYRPEAGWFETAERQTLALAV
ncbi:metallophosphoesterase [Ramlibacter sp.]|uniref:metallophosphoesterase family protein n=1 Tax=Ramlibacter sp. TaxID=1917967 RepID=UPI002C4244E3|nr:metallophosphoesterase [Ramlibacter sp.]HWI81546.1 metallophosphoesterase [Ramlibacter sp.]